MGTFFLIFELFPLVLNAVVAIEAAAPIAKTGPEKVALVLTIVEQAYESDPLLQKLAPQLKYAAIVQGLVGSIVGMLNLVGAFKKSVPVVAPAAR